MNRWRRSRCGKTAEELPSQDDGEQEQPVRRPIAHLFLLPFGCFAAAFRFLTIIPLPGRIGTTEKELAHAVPFFPLVGLLLGCMAAPAAKMLFLFLPPLPAALLTTFVLLAFSGGLHLDGLADTADGFFSARSRERMLEIMKDSNIGTMGAAALALLILFKTACLASLPEHRINAVFLMPIAGRAAILLLMALLPYGRESGLGRLFPAYFNSCQAKMAALAGLFLFILTAQAAAGLRGLAAVFAVLLLAAAFAALCCRKIGGVTGDTLGAACELAEAAALSALAVKTEGLL